MLTLLKNYFTTLIRDHTIGPFCNNLKNPSVALRVCMHKYIVHYFNVGIRSLRASTMQRSVAWQYKTILIVNQYLILFIRQRQN